MGIVNQKNVCSVALAFLEAWDERGSLGTSSWTPDETAALVRELMTRVDSLRSELAQPQHFSESEVVQALTARAEAAEQAEQAALNDLRRRTRD